METTEVMCTLKGVNTEGMKEHQQTETTTDVSPY